MLIRAGLECADLHKSVAIKLAKLGRRRRQVRVRFVLLSLLLFGLVRLRVGLARNRSARLDLCRAGRGRVVLAKLAAEVDAGQQSS